MERNRSGKKITVKLITDKNIENKSSATSDDIAEALIKLTHVRLDRLEIQKIENLDCLGCVTNLYLQQNKIECIENLEFLINLRFLTLAGNKIGKIQNLKTLKSLKFLDLSSNCIEYCDRNELPSSLLILSLKDNPCCEVEKYRDDVVAALPNLQELDGVPIETNYSYNSDDDDDDEEFKMEENNLTSLAEDMEEGGELKISAEDILERARVRLDLQNQVHEERMLELTVKR